LIARRDVVIKRRPTGSCTCGATERPPHVSRSPRLIASIFLAARRRDVILVKHLAETTDNNFNLRGEFLMQIQNKIVHSTVLQLILSRTHYS